ncbi:FAD:protein FMN transferase [Pelagimonas sp. KU-00592-HH]|uniref:FAD:protein FMN transferase n=1 Tax=Pelagimonas sp. KU-00592-HH TaxID=3127651 RepID=UPI003107ADC1
MTQLNRRRFLAISAAMGAVPALAQAEVARWQGRALGGQVSMQLVGVPESEAQSVFAAVEAELARLEGIFSLYRSDSEVSRLNRDGVLEAPSPELLQVLSVAGAVHTASGGHFDPTVQPLWQALAEGRDPQRAQEKVGWQRLRFDIDRVVLDGALTLNGIAQGAITDRISDLLKARGLRDVLVDMGEIAAIGGRADGTPWAVGVARPEGDVVARLKMTDRALATSAPLAMSLGNGGHILGPNGEAAKSTLVSVSASKAVLADALSTALCLVEPSMAVELVSHFKGARIEVLV